jgi:hypothetical protein
MKNRKYTSNLILPVVLGIFLLVCVLIRTFNPMAVLPKLDIPMVVALSLAALLVVHYLFTEHNGCDVIVLILAALTFGLLPYVSGFATVMGALKLALVGGIAFFVTAWLFGEMMERLSSGPVAKAAPVLSALGLYLAAQCFAGMIL